MVGNYIRGRFFLTTLFVLLKVSDGWALPGYLPSIRNMDGNHERKYLIEQYVLLLCHGVDLSVRQLKRVLRSRGL